jgi:four helix bundle protein
LPDNDATASIRTQLLDSAGSTDSNYRGACRGRTRPEFISKVAVAAEEADESKGWLSALLAAGYGDREETQVLIHEADELTAIFTASHKTAKSRLEAARAAAKRRKPKRR